MATVHFINVDPGDCTIIQHNSGRTTMIDICDGYLDQVAENTKAMARRAFAIAAGKPLGNFRMADQRTNPIDYAEDLGIDKFWRFVLTHPDMDHMDGLADLCDRIGIAHFWHTGVTRAKPPFDGGRYKEADWDRYAAIKRSGVKGISALKNLAGTHFKFANRDDDEGNGGGDGLQILAPSRDLVRAASNGGDINDGSYVLLYRSGGLKIVFPGDAHDDTWSYVLENYAAAVGNVDVLIAPHHGRGSDRSYDFLDHLNPQFTLFGNAPSEHLDYGAWYARELPFITSNQAGNVVLEIATGSIAIYIQNEAYAAACGRNVAFINNHEQKYVHFLSITPRT